MDVTPAYFISILLRGVQLPNGAWSSPNLMQILYVSQLVPYPVDAGPKVRIYHLLRHLAAAGHRTTLLAFRRPGDRPEAFAHLRQFCEAVHTVPMLRSPVRDAWHLLIGLLSGEPFLIRRDSVRDMYVAVRTLVRAQQFDAVHADQLWMAQYALAAKSENGEAQTPRLILDQHNAMHLIPRRLAMASDSRLRQRLLAMESRNLGRYEVETCAKFDHVAWVTEEDRQAVVALAERNGNGELSASDGSLGPEHSVIPICVDPAATSVLRRSHAARRVTFLGGLHWPPNAQGILWFVREVWPMIQRQVPSAVLTIIGKSPPPALTAPGPDLNLDVTGYVEDPLPYLSETAAFIVPLHAGGGMRVKILDAWSWGLPVVSTTIGAEGICHENGHNLLLADNAQRFGQAVVRLLRKPDLGARLGAAGRKTVESHYNWQHVYRAWDEIYANGHYTGMTEQ